VAFKFSADVNIVEFLDFAVDNNLARWFANVIFEWFEYLGVYLGYVISAA